MVSTTYAWFTLSTAPEVTGITTQVGANGNLEIALLTTDTYNSTASISSSTGDSIANTASNHSVTDANVTWGNLIDLDDSSYGLTDISLLPASLNLSSSKVNTTSPLSIPVYGADGRVSTVGGDGGATVSAVKSGTAFTYDSSSQTYGVRAVGVASNLSARQLAYTSAKSSFNSARSSATVSTAAAISANSSVFADLALATSAPTTFSQAQVKGALAIAQGMKADLETIVSAYKNFFIAKVAADTTNVTETAFDEAKTAINGASASTLASVASSYGASEYSTTLNELATAQSNVDKVIADLTTKSANANGVSFSDVSEDLTLLLGGTTKSDIIGVTDGTTLYLTKGVIGTIANNAGKFLIVNVVYTVYGAPTSFTSTSSTSTGTLSSINVTDATFSASSSSNITDTYGYVLDFAFRTNASSSSLLLQTAAENRVYSDGSNGTQGSGSNVTLTYSNGLQQDQAEKLLKALRIVFYDPELGTVYATAACSNVTKNTTSASADLYLSTTSEQTTLGKDNYEVATSSTDGNNTPLTYKVKEAVKTAYTNGTTAYTNYSETIDASVYNNLDATTTTKTVTTLSEDKGAITALTQNTAKKVSVLVYLDGENIDNTAVVNAASSGALDLNLQFSSSAELVPMSNTALKTLTAAEITGTAPTKGSSSTYTVSASGKTVKEVTWSSSSDSIATVAGVESAPSQATVTGVDVGEATITAKVTFTDNTTATATVKVNIAAASSGNT
jgi:uncharacterized protein (DUF427 family)